MNEGYDNQKIKVKSRKEFMKIFRKIFIPSCNRLDIIKVFDIGYAINNWTMFFVVNEDGSFTTVELES